jgi:hypothetical protein
MYDAGYTCLKIGLHLDNVDPGRRRTSFEVPVLVSW